MFCKSLIKSVDVGLFRCNIAGLCLSLSCLRLLVVEALAHSDAGQSRSRFFIDDESKAVDEVSLVFS